MMVRSKVYECPVPNCGKVFLSFQGSKEHRKVHGSQRYCCSESGCGKTFKWRSSLASHKRSHVLKVERLSRDKAMISSSPIRSASSYDDAPVTPTSDWENEYTSDIGTNSLSFDGGFKQEMDLSVLHDVGIFGRDDNDHLYLFSCENLSPLSTWHS